MRAVIVGTGTEIGKTHLGVALVAAAAKRGWSVCGLKPIESGVPDGAAGEDAAALAAVSTSPVSWPQPCSFRDPVSPHLAARRAGVAIDVARARQWVHAHAATWVFVETAGGLLSPLARGVTNLDLGVALEPDAWILLGVDRLGVLHDVSACRLAMEQRGCARPVVVLGSPAVADASTGTNADELSELGIAERVLAMPRGAPLSEECQSVAARVLDRLAEG